MMKKGKEIKMGKTYDNFKVNAGTVDSKNPTSVYINISAWGEPTQEDTEHYVSVISGLKKEIKNFIYNNLPLTYNKHRSIVDLDIRESGIAYGKRSFMNCEITLFQIPRNGNLLMSTELKKSMSEITDSLIKEVLEKYDYFEFHKNKK
jgi:hypothetical protein